MKIKTLNKLDSGWYSCGMVRPLSQETYRRFKILVSNGEFPLESTNENEKEIKCSCLWRPEESSHSQLLMLYTFHKFGLRQMLV